MKNIIQKVTNANVVTPIKVETFKKWLLSFPKKELQLLFDGKQNMKTLTDKITKEVLAGRVAGPFQSLPFINNQISPLGLVPKKCPGEFHIIHHLSYPEGSFINNCFCVDLEKQ
jgi:hypothetical protein